MGYYFAQEIELKEVEHNNLKKIVIFCLKDIALFSLIFIFHFEYSKLYASSINIELHSLVYEDVEFHSVRGMMDTSFLGILPYSRDEVAKLIFDAGAKGREGAYITESERGVLPASKRSSRERT